MNLFKEIVIYLSLALQLMKVNDRNVFFYYIFWFFRFFNVYSFFRSKLSVLVFYTSYIYIYIYINIYDVIIPSYLSLVPYNSFILSDTYMTEFQKDTCTNLAYFEYQSRRYKNIRYASLFSSLLSLLSPFRFPFRLNLGLLGLGQNASEMVHVKKVTFSGGMLLQVQSYK